MENSKIEWCHNTFNPWIGCTKVQQSDGTLHPACENCYAEELSGRYGWAKWGKGKPRKATSDANWKKPLAWDRRCAKAGIRERVFCASLSDIFDSEVSQDWREHLFDLIDRCPNLDWLILTKRPENISLMIPPRWKDVPPKNVMMGTSVSDQKTADEFIPCLLGVGNLFKLFVSIEPLLGYVNLNGLPRGDGSINFLTGSVFMLESRGNQSGGWDTGVYEREIYNGLSWVIVGGESGAKARPMHPEWVRSIRNQCKSYGVPFLFKQWGEWSPITTPDGKQIRQEKDDDPNKCYFSKTGKKAAGRLLDGVEYNEYPNIN